MATDANVSSECDLAAFRKDFCTLTDHQPFPWQEKLYHAHFAKDLIPPRCTIPTGLGKTCVLGVWLIALAHGRKLPRRLVYVVNRRTVVDQTTNEAIRRLADAWADHLGQRRGRRIALV